MDEAQKSKSWWQSVPVILTALGTILAATATLVGTIDKTGWFGSASASAKPEGKVAPSLEPPAKPLPSTFTREFRLAKGGGTPETQRSPQLDERVEFETAGELRMKFQLHPGACSQIRLSVLLDDKLIKETDFFDEDTGTLNLGPVPSGRHTLTLSPEGRVGGCNGGTLGAWGGTLTLHVSA
jgi:hypothetical protein